MEERIQKILARAGYGSRRSCERFITAGRVTVNGHTAILGGKADPHQDKIFLDGKPISIPDTHVYIALYKPRGVLSTVEAPDPRPTVINLVSVSGKVYPVGRLDVESEGLILLTNDGDLADKLTHPRYEHEKEYRVLVAVHPDEKQIDAWQHGVVMSDGHKSAPVKVTIEGYSGKGAWLRVIMTEGRKRQIRETGSLIGLPVVRIIRTRIGTLLLGRLKPKEWRQLTKSEIQDLKNYSQLDRKEKRKQSAQSESQFPNKKVWHRTQSTPDFRHSKRTPTGNPGSRGRKNNNKRQS